MNNEDIKKTLEDGKVFMQLSATVPVVQYGNLTPTFYGIGEDTQEVSSKLESNVVDFWNKYCESGKELNAPSLVQKNFKKVKSDFTGVELLFDEETHTYYSLDQQSKYLSGSTFANKFKGPFPADFISAKMADKYKVNQKDILDMWKLNGAVSTNLGSAIHEAIQLYGEYLEISKAVKDGSDESALHSNYIMKDIVKAFFTNERKKEKAVYEAFVADEELKLCGFIDRLVITGDKKCIIEDFKTNPDITKPVKILKPFTKVIDNSVLGNYWLQLSFYAHILERAGWEVEKLRILNLVDGEWVVHESKVIDIKEGLNA